MYDVNFNNFYLEVYIFIRGLERILLIEGGYRECCKENVGDFGYL